ncbi:class I SAM-dependent methyltransferase [Actinokineospora auranticolor]|uniref:Methyltransferase family protein n=1 Tax=Actinokineospora auranticolor TaxID=155976 RepID=A0A2S6GKK4_9PSEU|nr:class I SAM-dependent methyltransferase [Actinokineospora auranticolor]PPK65676.1 methyltransferase family protein [Actinokineospora auranticolor]
MRTDDWLANTRESYDTVVASYADQMRGAIAKDRYLSAALSLFAESVDGGPVADVGCGSGHVTAHLAALGVTAFGVDLSPEMVAQARREYPDLRFEVGSMTDLDLPDASVSGVLAWWTLIHIPDAEIPGVLAHFHRVLRPGGRLQVGFHTGDESHLKTQGYGGHPMNVHVHRRPPERVAAWLREAGFEIEAHLLIAPDSSAPQALLFARRHPETPEARD